MSSCVDIATTRTYNRSRTSGSAVSAPIYLSFRDSNQGAIFYLILERKIPSEDFLLRVRWISPNTERQFDGPRSTIQFLVDQDEIITLTPTKRSKIASYNIDDNTVEEEMHYYIARLKLDKIANAKSVVVELTGRYNIMTGKLNKFQSFRAIKDFLNNN